MGKNVVIYSDGTGQAGGFRFDENRSNIYKLYRATRYGPDSIVDPNVQFTFYDPGLGSQADGGQNDPHIDMTPGLRFTECIFDGQFNAHLNVATIVLMLIYSKSYLSGHAV